MLKQLAKRLLGHHPNYVADYTVPPEQARGKGELFELFRSHRGRTIFKWDHYIDLYERHFSDYRGSARMLEIGVFKGGSLELWRKYFGDGATIFGVDIDPACATRCDAPNQVRIGSQDDPDFLKSVVAEMGGLDIVLDDGSHIAEHQRTSFKALFPLLRDGGIYAIEDLHTSYWKEHHGGYRRRGSAIELVKSLIDDMHLWWHDKGGGGEIGGIHVYDSIVFIEKANQAQPRAVWVGAAPEGGDEP